MATVHARERPASNRKPFSWLSRLYKRSATHEDMADKLSPEQISGSSGNLFLDLGPSAGTVYTANDISSLRPTLSTRPPSLAQSTISNAAVHNLDGVSSPVDPQTGDRLGLVIGPESTGTAPGSPSIEDLGIGQDDSALATPLVGQAPTFPEPSGSSELMTDTSVQDSSTQRLQNEGVFSRSSGSSVPSLTPSIFTTKTVDTQPTVLQGAGSGSIMSARTGGPGAMDNASMLTLASSSKGRLRRRNSTDTNCSVRALAPGSARGSFESSRTGLTDTRRIGVPNSGYAASSNDGHYLSSNRNSRIIFEGSSRRSVSGLSTMSDAHSGSVNIEDEHDSDDNEADGT